MESMESMWSQCEINEKVIYKDSFTTIKVASSCHRREFYRCELEIPNLEIKPFTSQVVRISV